MSRSADRSATSSVAPSSAGDDVDRRSVASVPFPLRPLIKRGLSDIQRSSSDRKNFAFTRLDLSGYGLSQIDGEIDSYKELKYINLSNNDLNDLSPISNLPHILALNVQFNSLKSLQSLVPKGINPSSSSIVSRPLQLIEADNNFIDDLSSISTGAFPHLYALTLAKNKLSTLGIPSNSGANSNVSSKPSTAGGGFEEKKEEKMIDLPTSVHEGLQLLDISFNNLSSLSSLVYFPRLRILNVRGNKIESCEGIDYCKFLERFDISDNRLSPPLSKELDLLKSNSNLKSISVNGNTSLYEEYEDPEEIIIEILIILPSLSQVNGNKITATERKAADTLKKEREHEKKKKSEAEEAERLEKQREEKEADDLERENEEGEGENEEGDANDAAEGEGAEGNDDHNDDDAAQEGEDEEDGADDGDGGDDGAAEESGALDDGGASGQDGGAEESSAGIDNVDGAEELDDDNGGEEEQQEE